ncbi:MAG: nuclear transport factor 2 family protein [Myxococcaceae bacterium]
MDEKAMVRLANEFLGAWNTQQVDQVLACYTEDLVYRDPNTRGAVEGAAGMRRYLTKLFAGWRMHWTLREAHLFQGGEGCAVRWHASFEKPGHEGRVETDGMDFVKMRGGKIAVNEVYFDRAVLAPLL